MVSNWLANKNVLFFCVQTFGLEKQIVDKLELLGANVTYFDERPQNNNLTKAIIRFKKDLYAFKIKKYYQRILEEIADNKFDYLLVIRGEIVPEFFLIQLRKLNPNCKFIFYNWDSFKNTNNTQPLLKYYDKKFTFDPLDAKNNKIFFRPLYFIDAYRELKSVKLKYDMLFLGTAHSDRYLISSKIKMHLESNRKKAFCFYYMQSKWLFYYKKWFDKSFKNFDYKKLSFKSLTIDEMIGYYGVSKVILDINHPNQLGLTMRTFETVGAKRKLITTNKEVLKYPFYHPNNILLIDRERVDVDLSFFDKEYVDMDAVTYEKFSIEGWIYNLFIDEDQVYWQSLV